MSAMLQLIITTIFLCLIQRMKKKNVNKFEIFQSKINEAHVNISGGYC